jgi:hypothetical protein
MPFYLFDVLDRVSTGTNDAARFRLETTIGLPTIGCRALLQNYLYS